MSTTPQVSLTSLINTYQKKDYVLWQILTALAKNNETLTDNFNIVVKGLNYVNKLELTVETGTDKLPTWRRITIPRGRDTELPVYSSISLIFVGVAFKPTLTGTFTGDIKLSRDNGTTWTTLFKPTPLNLTCSTGNEFKSWSDLAIGTLYDGDLLRIDCSAAGGATGLEATLLGSYNT